MSLSSCNSIERAEMSLDLYYNRFVVMGDQENQSNTSTPAPGAGIGEDVDLCKTPFAFNDNMTKAIFRDMIKLKVKKRKVISPLSESASLMEDDLTENEAKIAEVVCHHLSSSMGELFSTMLDEFKMQFEQAMEGSQSKSPSTDDTFLQMLNDEISTLRSENDELRELYRVTEGRLTRAEKTIDDQNEKILQLEAHSMRDNLVFYNIKEEAGENTESVLRDFLGMG